MSVTTCRCAKCDRDLDTALENVFVIDGVHVCEPCLFKMKHEPELEEDEDAED